MSITFDEACKKAYDYYITDRNETGLCSAKDIGGHWLFEAGNPDVISYGLPSIIVDKKNGDINLFMLPDEDNFKLLDRAIEVSIPKSYIFK